MLSGNSVTSTVSSSGSARFPQAARTGPAWPQQLGLAAWHCPASLKVCMGRSPMQADKAVGRLFPALVPCLCGADNGTTQQGFAEDKLLKIVGS